MFETFQARAEEVSAEVHRFATRARALEFIVDFLRAEGVADAPGSYALWADGPFLNQADRDDLGRRVPGLRFEVTRDRAAQTKIGLSQMDWGLADTGTLAQNSTAVEQRLVSTLPEIHVALVHTQAVLPDLASLLARVDPATMPYLALITGPSRTADIERVLTIGVHGPLRLVIVGVDEPLGVAA
ncbi:MAG: lactate utilization protein [Proteobacteria bacterium]|nr:lactate utilization protein [Pseudomonadota bacterium]MBU1741135.1 lactate utilization protein [Pseudomonadota bacterium]